MRRLLPLIRVLSHPLLFWLALAASGASGVLLYGLAGLTETRVETGYDAAQVERTLHSAAIAAALSTRIDAALDADRIDAAAAYVALADHLGAPVAPPQRARLDAASGWAETSWRNGKACVKGAVLRETEGVAEIACAIASDLVGVGDVLDLIAQGRHYAHDDEVDRLVVGLSVLGLAASAATYGSAGAGAPLAAAVGTLKVAKRSGRLSKPLAHQLTHQVDAAADLPGLRRRLAAVPDADLASRARVVAAHVRHLDLTPIRRTVADLDAIRANTSLVDGVRLLRHADRTEDLALIARLSRDYGRHSVAVMDLLGKNALKITRQVARFAKAGAHLTLSLLASLGGLLLSLLGLLAGKLAFGGAYPVARRLGLGWLSARAARTEV